MFYFSNHIPFNIIVTKVGKNEGLNNFGNENHCRPWFIVRHESQQTAMGAKKLTDSNG